MKKIYLAAAAAFLLVSAITAQTKVPSFFSDNMVLQKGIDIPVWGTRKP